MIYITRNYDCHQMLRYHKIYLYLFISEARCVLTDAWFSESDFPINILLQIAEPALSKLCEIPATFNCSKSPFKQLIIIIGNSVQDHLIGVIHQSTLCCM